MFIEGPKVYLRYLEYEDTNNENYMSWLNDYEMCQHNSHGVFQHTHNKMIDYYEYVRNNENKIVVFAIIHKDDDIHAGNITLQNIDWINRKAEYAIIVDKQFWGEGVGFEASKLIIGYAFNVLNLNRIYCGTFETNIGMQKLALKLGMKKEGIREKDFYKNGKYIDVYEYGLLKENYQL